MIQNSITMTITEYNATYSQHIDRIVERYVMTKYKATDTINCFFEPYHINTDTNAAICFEPELVMLSKEGYATLLKVIVKHRNIRFQELPLYISKDLYRHILDSFNFVFIMDPDDHPFAMEEESYPIGVSMSTLMKDAKEIIGEKSNILCLQSCKPLTGYDTANVFVTIWMGIMEVSVDCQKTDGKEPDATIITHRDIYGMINVNAVQQALHIKMYDHLSSVLSRLFEENTSDNQENMTWLARWLDTHNIKFTQAEGTFQRDYSGYGYKFKDIEI